MSILDTFYAAMSDERSPLLWASLAVLSLAAVGFVSLLVRKAFFAKTEGSA